MTLTVPSIEPTTTTLQAIKEQIQSHLGGPSVVNIEKIKILLNKKPIPASKKSVANALDGSEASGEVELGVMVMGGAPDPPPQTEPPPSLDASIAAAASTSAPESEKVAVEAEEKKPALGTPMEGVETSTKEPVQPGEASGADVLETAEFWDDLQGFLEQRTRSAEEARKLKEVFQRAWRSSKAVP